jgi:small-conductance mechanosensitive channel
MSFWEQINWQSEIAGNSLEKYALVIGIFAGLVVVLGFFQKYILWRLKHAAEKTVTEIDDVAIQVASSIKPPFYFVLAGFIAINFLAVSDFLREAIEVGIIVLLVYQAVQMSQIILDYLFRRFLLKEQDTDAREAFKSINRIVMGAIWAFGILVILQNLGLNITSIIAGLGIGGVAIALASKEILSDLFSSLAIVLDKPFVPGDFIVVGEHMGVVQKVGIKNNAHKGSSR